MPVSRLTPASNSTFIGRGWSFPPDFTHDGGITMVAGEEDIRQSLFILFATISGERVMLQDYGCNLMTQVFEIINATTLTHIEDLVAQAILFHEPRISVEKITPTTDQAADGLVEFKIDYTIKTTNSRNNIVYPFYLSEGNNVRVI